MRDGGDFLGGGGGSDAFASDDVFPAAEDKVNHARQVGFEFFLASGIAPRGVATGALDFTEVAEFARGGDEDVVDEDRGIALDSEFIGQLGGSEVFGDKGDLAGVFGGDFLNQQTCWVRDISSVGPSDEGDIDGFAGGLQERRGGLLRGEIGGKDLIEDDAGTAPFVGSGSRTIGVGDLRCSALEEELGDGIVLFVGGEFFSGGTGVRS